MSLTLEQITKNFRGFQAVEGVSFALERGEVVGFLGPNGAGKTTTMRMIAGLITPTSGKIRLEGKLSAMIEEPSFYPYLSGLENLKYAATLAGIPERSVGAALERVGLTERQHNRVSAYSQGMRQRLGLARTLMTEPDVLLLDEPTNGLDPQGVADMRDLIRDISSTGMTVLLSSHILAEVEKICPRVLIIAKGRIQADGRVRELFNQLGAEGVSMNIDTPEVDKALELMKNQSWVQDVFAHAGGTVVARIAHDDLFRVAPLMVEHRLPLLGLRPDVESLEQIYLRAVGDKTLAPTRADAAAQGNTGNTVKA